MRSLSKMLHSLSGAYDRAERELERQRQEWLLWKDVHDKIVALNVAIDLWLKALEKEDREKGQ